MSAPGRHARPGPDRLTLAHRAWIVRDRLGNRLRWWYDLPLPLAALLAMLMPVLAVRHVRRSNTAVRRIADAMARAMITAGGDFDRPPEAPAPRHLHLVN